MTGEWRDVVRSLNRTAEDLLCGEIPPCQNVYAYIVGILEWADPDLKAAIERVLEANQTVRLRQANPVS